MSLKRQFGEYMAKFPEKTRRIALNLRVMILKIIPRVSETVHTGMKWITYGIPHSIIAIKPEQKTVNLFFFEGVKLKDPYKLLKGSGARLRFISISEVGQYSKNIRKLIEQAYFLSKKKKI